MKCWPLRRVLRKRRHSWRQLWIRLSLSLVSESKSLVESAMTSWGIWLNQGMSWDVQVIKSWRDKRCKFFGKTLAFRAFPVAVPCLEGPNLQGTTMGNALNQKGYSVGPDRMRSFIHHSWDVTFQCGSHFALASRRTYFTLGSVWSFK